MANDLDQQIIRQIEYYFGDINLPKDKFLQEKIKEDEGWVPLEVLLTFKRLAALSTDTEVIAAAVEKSEIKLVEVSEDRKKLRRNPEKPAPEMDDERRKELMKRTAYAKGFPLDEELNSILTFLEAYGIESCTRRSSKDHKFKGSCFIIFKDVDKCKEFIEKETIKYKDTELIRKWQSDYLEGKKKEIEERKKAKKEKKGKADEKPEKPLEFPKGAVVHFKGLEEGQTLTREELRDKVKEVGETDVAFVDFSKGDLEGYLRFPEEDNAVEFVKKLTDGELEVETFKLKLRVLQGEEEEEYLKKTSDTVIELRKKQKQSSRNNRKRKGNFGGHGRDAKAKKNE
ncbi:hypothetical protein NQ315_015829 [Exocentrus adspersus]|uniref:La protein homolog n=1 Tax=Exocentrus adspersus TaxID=1586481 RepID=A0AAV8W3L5_9CUCU|nr:hypothetical protein NQ315_015829 [Exocentrus adspersus]